MTPAMTMTFRIEDSSLLAALENGKEDAFKVDNTAADFSNSQLAAKPDRFDTTGGYKTDQAVRGQNQNQARPH